MQCEYCGSTARPINVIGELDEQGKETGRTTIMCHTCEHTGVPFFFSAQKPGPVEEQKAQE